jgi:hypothetical protein
MRLRTREVSPGFFFSLSPSTYLQRLSHDFRAALLLNLPDLLLPWKVVRAVVRVSVKRRERAWFPALAAFRVGLLFC